jgi:hypothetical protein
MMMEPTSESPITVLISNFGQMAVFQDGEQRTDLQRPWILMIADYFRSKGIDPTKVDFKLVDGKKVKFVDTLEGYNWRIL